MVRNDQTRPIAPASTYYPRSDEVDKAISAEFDLRQNGCLRCCGCATALLLLAVTTLVLFFTILRIRDPVVTAERFAFSQLQRGKSLSLLNLSVEITMRNPNTAAFRYENVTTSLYYRGEVVGKGGVPPGKVGAWRRKQLNVTVEVDGEKVVGAAGFVGDWRNGNLSFRCETWITGKVKITDVIKKKLTVRFDRNLSYVVDTQQVILN